METTYCKPFTSLVVVHPVEHDLRGPVPSGRNVPRHLVLCRPSQSEVQDLQLTVLIDSNVGGLQIPERVNIYS